MTEDEARKKWCPFVMADNLTPALCIASECMAWRWDAGENVANPNRHNTDHGYCGLAGKP